jgi:hypothetical protein
MPPEAAKAPILRCSAQIPAILRGEVSELEGGCTQRNVSGSAGQLTKTLSPGKVVKGRAHGPFFLSPTCWEVVQLAVHQILDLIILVRVQASQPIF